MAHSPRTSSSASVTTGMAPGSKSARSPLGDPVDDAGEQGPAGAEPVGGRTRREPGSGRRPARGSAPGPLGAEHGDRRLERALPGGRRHGHLLHLGSTMNIVAVRAKGGRHAGADRTVVSAPARSTRFRAPRRRDPRPQVARRGHQRRRRWQGPGPAPPRVPAALAAVARRRALLAASGHRVICPDLRGAGWTTAEGPRIERRPGCSTWSPSSTPWASTGCTSCRTTWAPSPRCSCRTSTPIGSAPR